MGRECCDDCCYTTSKVLLIIVNILFFLAGALMLAFGITAEANPALLNNAFAYVFPSGTSIWLTSVLMSNAVFMIVVGCCALLISLFGWIGACCEVKWMLLFYAIVLIILLCAEIALIIYAAIYPESFKSTVQDAMSKSLKKHNNDMIVTQSGTYYLPTGPDDAAWVAVQSQEKCCGVNGYADYNGTFTWINSNLYPNQNGTALIPLSCCNFDWSQLSPTNYKQKLDDCVQLKSNAYYSSGCGTMVGSLVYNYKVVAIGIAAGTAGLAIILIALAFVIFCHLCRKRGGKLRDY